MENKEAIYLVSDSVGETAEVVAKAVASQFDGGNIVIHRNSYVENMEDIEEVITLATKTNSIIAYTIVVPFLKEYLDKRAQEEGIWVVDLLKPLIDMFQKKFKMEPHHSPGLIRKLDDEYFRKIEAIEFAVKYDDGKDPRGLTEADIVIIGVSRTSKTPLSMYLASSKRLKVANIPLVPEVSPPDELFEVPRKKCVGLIISPDKLNDIRKERLKSLGLNAKSSYADMERILSELEYADKIMKRVGCPIIDVSNNAVEETASLILEMLKIERNY